MADRRITAVAEERPDSQGGFLLPSEKCVQKSTGILPYQIAVCTVLLLCLLGGWMTDAQWFAEGKQLLLVQINAADKTKRVGNMLSGILKETKRKSRRLRPRRMPRLCLRHQIKRSRQGCRRKNWSSCTVTLNSMEKSGEEEQAASTGLTGMGGYLPVSVSVLAPPDIQRRKGVCFLRWRSVQNRFCH